jgi:hypothetical protein
MFEMMRKINEAKDIAWKLAHKGEKCNPFLCGHTPSAEEWLPVLLLTLEDEIRREMDFKKDWGGHCDGFDEANKVIVEIQEALDDIRNG